MITDFGVDFMKNIRETRNNPTLQLWSILSMGRACSECQVGMGPTVFSGHVRYYYKHFTKVFANVSIAGRVRGGGWKEKQ